MFMVSVAFGHCVSDFDHDPRLDDVPYAATVTTISTMLPTTFRHGSGAVPSAPVHDLMPRSRTSPVPSASASAQVGSVIGRPRRLTTSDAGRADNYPAPCFAMSCLSLFAPFAPCGPNALAVMGKQSFPPGRLSCPEQATYIHHQHNTQAYRAPTPYVTTPGTLCCGHLPPTCSYTNKRQLQSHACQAKRVM